MEGIAVLLGVVGFAAFVWFLARFCTWLAEIWPVWAVALLSIVIILVSTYAFAVVMTIADPNYLLTSLPFWPSSWLRGY